MTICGYFLSFLPSPSTQPALENEQGQVLKQLPEDTVPRITPSASVCCHASYDSHTSRFPLGSLGLLLWSLCLAQFSIRWTEESWLDESYPTTLSSRKFLGREITNSLPLPPFSPKSLLFLASSSIPSQVPLLGPFP